MEDTNLGRECSKIANKRTELNPYDSALKQLMLILKSKASDNLKQLEELWDSINNSTNLSEATGNKNGKTRTSPTPSSSSQSPVNILSENSNDSNSSTNSTLKRDYSKTNPTNLNTKSIKKAKISDNNSKSNANFKTINKPKKDNVSSDMLDDFTCVICKNFNQLLNNKLIECRKCSSLYHQLCHVPKIRNDEIDDKDFEECSTCKNGSSSEDNEIATINMKQSVRSNVRSPDSFSNGLMKKHDELNGQSESRSNTTNASETNISDTALKNGSVKGLAGLATKMNGSAQEKRSKTPTQSNEKNKNELFNLNKKSIVVSNGQTNKLKTSNSVNTKKSGLFNLSNGLNSQKTSFSSLKDKKASNSNKLGEIQKSAPAISVTRKIS